MASHGETATWVRWAIGILAALITTLSGIALAQATRAEETAQLQLIEHSARAEKKNKDQDEKIDKVADAVAHLVTQQAVTNERLKRIADALEKLERSKR